MSISTRRGDSGSTSLAFGKAISKAHPRVEAYGTVDELGSTLGVARASSSSEQLQTLITGVQKNLLTIGAMLATADEDRDRAKRPGTTLTDAALQELDSAVADLEARVPPLRQFVLPGDTLISAYLHVSRTVCRRAERRVAALSEAGSEIEPIILKYLNRLSDVLWLLAREDEEAHRQHQA